MTLPSARTHGVVRAGPGSSLSVVVIGGGIAGLACAWSLARRGARVILLEASTLGSGATGAAFGGLRQQFGHPLSIELARRGLAFWRSAAARFAASCGFEQTGYLLLAGSAETWDDLRAAAATQRRLGCGPVHEIHGSDLAAIVPWVDADALVGGTWTPEDGRVSPSDCVAALAAACRRLGVEIRQRYRVTALQRAGDIWQVSGPDRCSVDHVVIAAGASSPSLLGDFVLPMTATTMHVVFTGPAWPGVPLPLTIDLDTGLVVDRQGDGLFLSVLGTPTASTEDTALAHIVDASMRVAPSLAELGVRRSFSAALDTTPDGQPYVGRVDDGLFVLTGFSGHGIMHAPPVAEALAAAITGAVPDLDLSEFDPRRPQTDLARDPLAVRARSTTTEGR